MHADKATTLRDTLDALDLMIEDLEAMIHVHDRKADRIADAASALNNIPLKAVATARSETEIAAYQADVDRVLAFYRETLTIMRDRQLEAVKDAVENLNAIGPQFLAALAMCDLGVPLEPLTRVLSERIPTPPGRPLDAWFPKSRPEDVDKAVQCSEAAKFLRSIRPKLMAKVLESASFGTAAEMPASAEANSTAVREIRDLPHQIRTAAEFIIENPGCSGDEVATHAGYSSPQSFSRAFNKHLVNIGFHNKNGYRPPLNM
jgi:hypothetical protein